MGTRHGCDIKPCTPDNTCMHTHQLRECLYIPIWASGCLLPQLHILLLIGVGYLQATRGRVQHNYLGCSIGAFHKSCLKFAWRLRYPCNTAFVCVYMHHASEHVNTIFNHALYIYIAVSDFHCMSICLWLPLCYSCTSGDPKEVGCRASWRRGWL